MDEAFKYYKQALKLNQRIGSLIGETNQLGNIGLFYLNKGELNEALKHLKRAERIATKIEYVDGIKRTKELINLIKVK